MNTIIKYENTNNLVKDICTIIDEAKQFAYQTVDTTLVLRNWYIGKRIDEEVLEGKTGQNMEQRSLINYQKN